MTGKPILAWIDIETTGLNPTRGEVLEIAMVLTHLNLDIENSFRMVIGHTRESLENLMDDYVEKMHRDSGLLELVYRSGNTCDDAAIAINRILNRCTRQAPSVHMAGSSIDFDRRWLNAHMPSVAGRFHHRVLDVSGYKLAFPDIWDVGYAPAHRAMDDVLYSIEEHRKMRKVIAHWERRRALEGLAARNVETLREAAAK